MLDVKVVWSTFEYGTEMVTPLSVANKHRKLSPVSKRGRPELIIRVICKGIMKNVIRYKNSPHIQILTYIIWHFLYKLGWGHTGVGET